MTNIPRWGTYSSLFSHVSQRRRKEWSGLNRLRYFFCWPSLLWQPCLSPRKRVDVALSPPGQGEAAIVRGHILIPAMDTEINTAMDTTDIPASTIMDKPRLGLTKPSADLPSQNQPIDNDKIIGLLGRISPKWDPPDCEY